MLQAEGQNVKPQQGGSGTESGREGAETCWCLCVCWVRERQLLLQVMIDECHQHM